MARGDTTADHVDVLIVGAGISGVDAAYRLKTRCRDRSFVILEARERVGGTWDLFRYPGVRSGFPFRPWPSAKAIVEGAAIRDYVEDTGSRVRNLRAHPLRSSGRARFLVVRGGALDDRSGA
jgi:cation diffusion facilitator CzcD-associated flavoprotein CzcO